MCTKDFYNMKYLTAIVLLLSLNVYSQRIDPHVWEHPEKGVLSDIGANLSNDTTIDIKFYHIDVEIALDSAYIFGSVKVGLTSLIDNLSSFKLDLDSSYYVDSISTPSSSFTFIDNIIDISLNSSYSIGEYLELTIYYKGVSVLAGGYKGLRYENHDDNEIIIASLSTPYLAHTWWPCKDGTQDKSDSTFIDITIKDTLISSIAVSAISNGMLDTIEILASKKKYRWKHYYPIVPYYVMVAISNYQHFQQIYEGENYTFPLDYYVFESHMEAAQEGVAMLPEVIDLFTDIFGPYPFLNEKYGMTQLGFYGAIENQTNTITNNMSLSWFNISVHELAHMWFADMITCNTWHHGWLNEGFATYSEALWAEFKYDQYQGAISNYEYYNEGTVYMDDVSDPFNVFQSIIYNKGAYVLHMLRGVLGDSVFFDVVYDYASDNEFMYKLATTEQFQLVCENISGEDLDYFFEQWIYDERYPRYYYNYDYNESTGILEFVIDQRQSIMGWREVFKMPMEIKIEFTDGSDTIIKVVNETKLASYSFATNKNVDNIELDPNKWILKTATWDAEIVVGVKNNSDYNISVFPNPNNGSFRVFMTDAIQNKQFSLSVIDMRGILLYTTDSFTNSIEIDGLKPGTYFVIIKTDNEYLRKKVIVTNNL